jgi:uncharacterized membrane protein YuzA (DUF378 family)
MDQVRSFAKASGESFANVARKFAREIALVLVIVGALNWGSHAFGFDLIAKLEGWLSKVLGNAKTANFIAKSLYITVAVAGLYILYERFDKNQSLCL